MFWKTRFFLFCILSILLGNLAIPGIAESLDCFPYWQSLHTFQTLENLGPISCLEVSSEQVVATGEDGLVVLERQGDGSLQPQGTLALSGSVLELTTCSNLAILAMGDDGLGIVDFSDPAAPALVGTLTSATPIVSVTTTDVTNLVASVTEDGVVRLIDLNLPSSPTVIGEVATASPMHSVTASPGYLYSGGEESLVTIDITIPSNPVVVDIIDNSSSLFSEFVANFTHLSVSEGKLLAVGTYWFEWTDGWTFYYEESPALEVFGLAAPAHPAFTAWAKINAQNATLVSEFAAVVTQKELAVFNPDTLVRNGSIPLFGTLSDVAVIGNMIYIASHDAGIQVVDASIPQTVVAAATFGEGESPLKGSARYAATVKNTSSGHWDSLSYKIYGLADPLNPVVLRSGSVGGMNASPEVRVFDVQGDYLAFAASSNYYGGPMGVALYDFSVDPYQVVALPVSCNSLVLDGEIAWMLEYNTLRAVSFSDFQSPVVVGSLDIPGESIFKSGEYWFTFRTSEPGIQLLDLSDPTDPQLGSFVSLPGHPQSFAFHKGHLLFVMSNSELAVIDPVSAEMVGSVAVASPYCKIASGDDVVVITLNPNFWVLTLDDPTNPTIVTDAISVPFHLYGASLMGDYVYLANYLNGPTVYDVSTPEQPVRMGNADGPGGSVYLGDNYLRTSGGVYPLNCELFVGVNDHQDNDLPAGKIQMGVAVPNPFNPVTEIKFVLKESRNVEFGIYDLKGQLVRTLVSGEMAAGPHLARWDGQDNSGVIVPSGVYFARLRAGNFVESRKLALIK